MSARELNVLYALDPKERRKLESCKALSSVVLPRIVDASSTGPGTTTTKGGKCTCDAQHSRTMRRVTNRQIRGPTISTVDKRLNRNGRRENIASRMPRKSRKANRTHQGYRYEPLLLPRMIRVIEIDPSQECTSPLSCHLKIAQLDAAPPYEALSYRWCGPKDGLLLCCGKDLSIRRNLKDALTRLRLPDVRRYIWADAVCINQDDHRERLGQIKLMGDIYRKASRVIVWLGEDTDNEAQQSLDRLESIALSHHDPPPPQDSWWNPVAAFYRREWFSRLWVFQEIAMATSASVHWGASSISWETVGRASVRIRTLHLQAIMYHVMPNVYNAYLFYKNSTMDCQESFLYMLQVTRKLQCGFRKDSIYALSGFATVDIKTDDFTVEPGVKEGTMSLYRRIARKILRRMRTLDLLSAVQHESPTISRPTWVPRWDIRLVNTLAPLGSTVSKYTASRQLPPPSIKWTGNRGRILRTLGVEFDTIVEVKQEMAGLQNRCKMTAAIINVLTQWFNTASPYPTGEPLDRVGCFTLTAGKDAYGMRVEDESQHLANFTAFWAKYGQATNQNQTPFSCGEVILGRDADSFLMAAGFASGGRKLFHTATGYVGIGPGLSQRGDIVCVLAGGTVPFVVRRDAYSSRRRRRFELIGESYVHGIMHGEATSRYANGEQATVAFNII
ncbi:HET-domain-containing protein [Lentithecium fluviatile CBS 122367]|uniref:HET-domain-containing protein n=1 Tax=Lentithecium fluviatile CBS 122367 TaxID=1168545 RepID=A0A6G1ID87_9PLEO|nr:HET-domain-containing protein [Lentithecium fluviatile CBS 122367]